MEVFIFLSYAAGLLIIFLLAKLFTLSGKILVKLIINSVCGLIILFAVNLIGGYFGVHIPVNFITGVGVGTLGVPGLILFYLISL